MTRRRRAEREILDRERQLRALNSELSLAEERERRRIATGLHDQVGHPLALAKLRLGELRDPRLPAEARRVVADIGGLLARAIEEIRSLSFELGSPVLYELGLKAALRSLGKRLTRQHGIRFGFSTDGRPKPLAEDSEVVLYRVFKELLVNIVKHARARKALVAVKRVEDEVWITVEDDGVGLEAGSTEVLATKGCFGLSGARERLERIGGRLVVEPAASGTRILAVGPLVEEPARKGR